MVELQPPPPPRPNRLTIFLDDYLYAEIQALSRARRQRPGRVATAIVETMLKARAAERDIGGDPPEEVATGGA